MQTIEINKIPALTWNWMKMNKGSISDDFDLSVKELAIQSNTNIQLSKGGVSLIPDRGIKILHASGTKKRKL